MAIYSWILEHSDIIGLIIDFIALVVSVILTVVIYKLERRHEKEHEAAEEKAQKAALAETARVFLIDNDDEVDYLPLAALAAKLKLKENIAAILLLDLCAALKNSRGRFSVRQIYQISNYQWMRFGLRWKACNRI